MSADDSTVRARQTVDMLVEEVRACVDRVNQRASTRRMRAVSIPLVESGERRCSMAREEAFGLPSPSDSPPPTRTAPPVDAGRYAMIAPRQFRKSK